MTLDARPFAFETVFAKDGAIVSESRSLPRYSQEDLERERARAADEGRSAETAKAEAATAAALKEIGVSLKAVLSTIDADAAERLRESTQLALAIARKIAGAALEEFGSARAEEIIAQALDAMHHLPRVTIRLAPATADAVEPRLARLIEDHHFDGSIRLRREAGLRRGDVILDWGEANLQVRADEIEARIDALLADAALTPDHSHE